MLNFGRIFGNVWKVEEEEPGISKMELFWKGGVNVSAVHGKLPEAMQKLFNVEADFFACGLSLVLHPKAQWYQRFMPTGAISKCMMRTEI
jgi:coproporphyrinogen III oxidase